MHSEKRSKFLCAGLLVQAWLVLACGSDRDSVRSTHGGSGGSGATSFDSGVAGAGGSAAGGGSAGSGAVSGSNGAEGSGGGSAVGGATGSGGSAGTGGTAGNGGGAAGTDGTSGAGSGGTGAVDAGHDAGIDAVPRIPAAPAECPRLATGNVTVLGQQVRLWVGPPGQRGPLVFYWHGAGSTPDAAVYDLASGLDEVTQTGGVVAAFTTSTRTGVAIGPETWFTGDFAMADIVAACGVAQGLVDPRRVYTAGCSAGGLRASVRVYARSRYLAAAMLSHGGIYEPEQLETASHVPAVITAHGPHNELWIVNFGDTSKRLDEDVASKGGFAVNCFHGGGMCQSPAVVKAAQWQFLKDHPFGVGASPYSGGLPASFPDYCTIVR